MCRRSSSTTAAGPRSVPTSPAAASRRSKRRRARARIFRSAIGIPAAGRGRRICPTARGSASRRIGIPRSPIANFESDLRNILTQHIQERPHLQARDRAAVLHQQHQHDARPLVDRPGGLAPGGVTPAARDHPVLGQRAENGVTRSPGGPPALGGTLPHDHRRPRRGHHTRRQHGLGHDSPIRRATLGGARGPAQVAGARRPRPRVPRLPEGLLRQDCL